MTFTHIANPVKVNAWPILKVLDANFIDKKPEDRFVVTCIEEREFVLTEAQVSRHTPVAGDYIVIQEDGYLYVNPKDVFERKYSPV